tara:strand:- start:886 stop:1347 length:462 start_codon:yes stop_codon:yes gene_type:complete
MKTDKLTICARCGSDACYVQEVNQDINNYFCYGCGFQSNTLLREGEELMEEQMKILPELYKDLKFTDKEGKVWFPSTANLSNQGMVFANGTTLDNWKWSAVKAIKIPKKEQKKFPKPGNKKEYYKYRMDMTTTKNFEERDFMDALSYIGVLPS